MAQPLEPATPFLHMGETDCVAGVVGLELRNPLGSKSARIAGEFQRIWPKWAQQRRFACELRRYQRAAAAKISPRVARTRRMAAGVFNMPGW
jgi:hypothetical protein